MLSAFRQICSPNQQKILVLHSLPFNILTIEETELLLWQKEPKRIENGLFLCSMPFPRKTLRRQKHHIV